MTGEITSIVTKKVILLRNQTKPTQVIKKQILYIFSFKSDIKLYQIKRNQTNSSHYSFLNNTKGNNCWSIEHVNISSNSGDLAVVKMTFMLVTLLDQPLVNKPSQDYWQHQSRSMKWQEWKKIFCKPEPSWPTKSPNLQSRIYIFWWKDYSRKKVPF